VGVVQDGGCETLVLLLVEMSSKSSSDDDVLLAREFEFVENLYSTRNAAAIDAAVALTIAAAAVGDTF